MSMIVEVLADADGVVMNESSDNLIVPQRTWRKFGFKRKAETPKTTDYGSRGSVTVPSKCRTDSYRQNSRKSVIVTPEPSVFSEESLRRVKNSSSDEDDNSDDICYKSSKLYKIIKDVVNFLVRRVLRLLVLFATLTFPFIMLIVGLTFWKDCPREWRIPLFLVVGGTVVIVSNIINTCLYVIKTRKALKSQVDMNHSTASSLGESEDEVRTSSNLTDHCRNKLPCQTMGLVTSLLHTFALTWFFAGCVWVYGAYEVEKTEAYTKVKGLNTTQNPNYCHPGIYSFAFWILNICFILLFLSLFVGLTHYVVTSFREKKAAS